MFVGDAPSPEIADALQVAVDHSFRVERKVRAHNMPVRAQEVAVVGLLDIQGGVIARRQSAADTPELIPRCRNSATVRTSASVIGLTSTARTTGMALQYGNPVDRSLDAAFTAAAYHA